MRCGQGDRKRRTPLCHDHLSHARAQHAAKNAGLVYRCPHRLFGFLGKLNKYFKTYLPAQIYLQYCETYPDSSYAHFWNAIDASCALFHQTAQFVAEQSGYVYPQEDEDGFRRYAEIIQEV